VLEHGKCGDSVRRHRNGEVQGLSRAFTDNGDGTITDKRTRLTWAFPGSRIRQRRIHVERRSRSRRWLSAVLRGHCDWRLPNVVGCDWSYGANPPLASAFPTTIVRRDVLTCSCGVGRWTSGTQYPLGATRSWSTTGGWRVAQDPLAGPGRPRQALMIAARRRAFVTCRSRRRRPTLFATDDSQLRAAVGASRRNA
jgi:hypothetical protein